MESIPVPLPGCPFRLSTYAQQKYTMESMQFILSFFRICDHGWLCQKCCYEYTGDITRTLIGKSRKSIAMIRLKKNTIRGGIYYSVGLGTFVIHMYFGRINLMGGFEIHCKNERCVNIQHYELRGGFFYENFDIHCSLSKRCIHGLNCAVCHWDFLEKDYIVGQPWRRNITNACRRGWYNLLQPNLNTKEYVPVVKSDEIWCVNPQHFEWMLTKEYKLKYFLSLGTEFMKKKSLQKKMLAA